MAQKLENRVHDLEAKLAALEAAFSRPEICQTCTCKPDIEKIKNDVQGLKMRMGKRD